FYEKAIDHKTSTARSNFYIAESYRLSNRIKEASPYYKAAIADSIEDESAYFYYALSLKANEKYKEGKQVLEDYLDKASDEDYIQLAERELTNLRKINDLVTKEDYF